MVELVGMTVMIACIIDPKTPSKIPSAQVITQMVIASGAQTSIPATKYFFMVFLP
jgi:hypothetical protein